MALRFKFKSITQTAIRSISMSSRFCKEEAIEELKVKNPYFNKYADKIAALQKTNPDEFLERLEKVDKHAKKPVVKERERNYSELLQPKKKVENESGTTHKKLSDVMKLELVKDETVEVITKIWFDYHKDKDVITAAIKKDQYNLLMERAKKHPVFIFPLPRTQGYEFMVLQFSANSVHFTPLLCYQVHKENAPECLNMTYYTEFTDKDLILMRGEIDANVINTHEAQCLANQLQLYYGQQNETKLNLLKKFTEKPDSFKHMDVIKELENIQLI